MTKFHECEVKFNRNDKLSWQACSNWAQRFDVWTAFLQWKLWEESGIIVWMLLASSIHTIMKFPIEAKHTSSILKGKSVNWRQYLAENQTPGCKKVVKFSCKWINQCFCEKYMIAHGPFFKILCKYQFGLTFATCWYWPACCGKTQICLRCHLWRADRAPIRLADHSLARRRFSPAVHRPHGWWEAAAGQQNPLRGCRTWLPTAQCHRWRPEPYCWISPWPWTEGVTELGLSSSLWCLSDIQIQYTHWPHY